LTTPLLEVDLLRLRQVGAAADDNISILVLCHDPLLDFLFHHIHLPSRKKFSIREGLQSIIIATYSRKALHVTIPRRDIVVSDRPIHRKTVSCRSFKVILAPPLYLSRP